MLRRLGELLWKHIRQPAFELLENLLESAQGNALPALFQAMQGGRGESEFSGEFRVSLITTPLFQEAGKLVFQRRGHRATLENHPFRMRNVFKSRA
jgi:hypothetical protein